jgi:hypothetical protein
MRVKLLKLQASGELQFVLYSIRHCRYRLFVSPYLLVKRGRPHQTDNKIATPFFPPESHYLVLRHFISVPYCSCHPFYNTNTVQSYCPKSNIVFLTLGCQTPLNSMLCSSCDERTHIHIHMYLFLSKPRTLTRLSRVAGSAGTVERVHTAPARSAMTARIHTAGLQRLNRLKFNCISRVTRHKLDLAEFKFGNTIFRCLCPPFVSKIKSKLFSFVYNMLP